MKAFTRIITTVALTAVSVSYGAFVLVEEFDDVSDWGAVDGGTAGTSGNGLNNTLTVNNGVGDFLVTDVTSVSRYKALGSSAIADGSTGTIFFQMTLPDAGGELFHFAGFTVGDTPGAYGGYNGYIFSGDDGTGPFGFSARNGDASASNPNPASTLLSAETTYNVWFVIDNSAKTYDVYFNTGGAAQGSDLYASGLLFRPNETPTGLAVETFGVFGQDNPNSNQIVSFDNLYVDNTGSNLAYAVPEPGTLALVGIALGALLVFRRKR